METPQGLRYFHHDFGSDCRHNPESERQVSLKHAMASTLQSLGWMVKTEDSGTAPDGARWDAAIHAGRDGRRIAICLMPLQAEFTADDIRRQKALADSGVSSFWLYEGQNFPVTRQMPAGHLDFAGDSPMVRFPFHAAHTSDAPGVAPATNLWSGGVALADMLGAVADGRVWFGTLRSGDKAAVRVDSAFSRCPYCHHWSMMLARVEIIPSAPTAGDALVFKASDIPITLASELVPSHLQSLGIAPLSRHYDPLLGRPILVNTCGRCGGALLESDYPDLLDRAKGLTQVLIPVSTNLERAGQRAPAARWRIRP